MAKGVAPCSASIHIDLSTQAGLVDDRGNVSFPICGGSTTLVPGKKQVEIHALLCTDETIHYPQSFPSEPSSGNISEFVSH
jgi:hypothetical protein